MIFKILKIVIFFLYMINFVFYFLIGYFFYTKTGLFKFREFFTNIGVFFLHKATSLILKDKIILLSDFKFTNEKINIINSNHTYQFDLFVIYYLFSLNNISGKQYTSISSNINIGFLDKVILNMIEACFVNKKIINTNFNKSLILWKKRKYKSYIINFFEGICKCDFKGISKYNNLLNPKYVIFKDIVNNNIKYITDIDIIYTDNNKILNCKNKDIYNKFFFNDIKIYVSIKNIKIENIKNSELWLDNLYLKKDKNIDRIIKKFKITK
jgi:hypothetical protein